MKKLYVVLDSIPYLEKRLSLFLKVFSVLVLLLIGYYWLLQIVRHAYYTELSEKSRIRNIKIVAPRGVIRDRNGVIIASSSPSFVLEIVREEVENKDLLLNEIANILKKDVLELKNLYETKERVTPRFYPIILMENLSREEVVKIEAYKWKLKGAKISYRSERSYPFNDYCSHLIGYVSQITKEDIERLKNKIYGAKIGKTGIESIFEDYLKGFDGVTKVEVDAYGRKQKVLYRLDPVSGGSIKLTIDWELQEIAEKSLGDKNGAVVAISTKTGEVLALVSHPNFDPNLFVKGLDKDEWKKINNNPFHPLQNKAIQGAYPPGSTFKIITAIAGLEEGVINEDTAFYCYGKKRLGNRDFRCWKDGGHGRVNIHKAMVESCDVFFYEVSLKLGPDKIAHYARLFGFGEKTSIGLPGELSGNVPDSQWKKKRYKQIWYDGDTLPYGIGQGYLTVTPLQLALSYAAFANGGSLFKPIIVKEIETNDGKIIKEQIPSVRKHVNLNPKTIEIIRKALIGVVNEAGGTGYASRLNGIIVAGKTGTAQVRSFKERRKLSGFHNDHAWFVGFAPAYDPEIVVCAFVMHGGHGGGVAAPIVKDVIEKYYLKKKVEYAKASENK
ncbi:MAG: penicillin-binding protein 2 [Proteobacteria bacterium]|nr:penicillin-binding protein 2 [Pseudomonadota bacterium]